ncbi:16S ribosomal RNA methyltransferase RsmE [Listeria floridensis FSL S10-1187]|uniref:Ribosomal RNA small subunit methyltransferase E n=1 Tax=Listeria floridensis FSL S10-1187 TaxID=1265817 RepID=A0ABN0RHC8_9LIST|nr:16S ribosomal RNA methyltransferase RsmE [Listeria floridensis FSL S10-1187]
MKANDRVFVVDLSERAFLAEITEVLEDQVVLRFLSWQESETELPIRIAIASGLPKGDKLDFIVQKGTELGAVAFYPFKAERSVTKWEPKKTAKKIERLERIAKEAAEQSHRTHIPKIEFASDLGKLLTLMEAFDYVVCAYEESSRAGEKNVLATVFEEIPHGASLLVIFGPEGGLSETEVEQFGKKDVHFAGLGPRILRTETAPLYLLAAASYHFELADSFFNE